MIPKIIWQTWHSRPTSGMQMCIDDIKARHPDFRHFLYDEVLCDRFIKDNYPEAYQAYIDLIPGAYKADLWRLCVLHKHGGIYLDVKFECVGDFTFHSFLDKNQFALDVQPKDALFPRIAIALIISEPRNPVLLECIHQIIKNVKDRNYGLNELDITGPDTVGRIVSKYNQTHDFVMKPLGRFQAFYQDNVLVMKEYYWYRTEQQRLVPHYSKMWKSKTVFQPKIAPKFAIRKNFVIGRIKNGV